MSHYDFYQHRECEYFPCHKNADPETFSCLFCFCPLYALGENCGGNFTYTENGTKDCSNCLIPHHPQNYERILSYMEQVLEMAKRGENPSEIA